jgi:hypothetical protein
MTTRHLRWPSFRVFEYALALTVLLALSYDMWHLERYGYFPQPFFYVPSDMWNDWFNTAYWSHHKGFFDVWGSVYPPLSAVFFKIFSSTSCSEWLDPRQCDWIGVINLHGFFVINLILISRCFLKIDRSTALPRSIALGAGLPMDYGLERGNLVIVCFTCLLLAYGPLVKSARLRWLAAGLAVNFKVYLIAAIFAQVGLKRWRWFEGAMIATVAVYLLTYVIEGSGTPMEIYRNIAEFSVSSQSVSILELWYSGTYLPAISLLQGDTFPITNSIGSQSVNALLVALPLLVHMAQATILAAFVAGWLRPSCAPRYRMINFAISLALITSEAGGYAQVFMFLFVFMEQANSPSKRFALLLAYALCIPAEIILTGDALVPYINDSFWAGRPVMVDYKLALGPFVRPLLIMLIPSALATTTLYDAVAGWWAERRGILPDEFASSLSAE